MSNFSFRPFDETTDRQIVLEFLLETLSLGNDEPVDAEEQELLYFSAVREKQERDPRFCSVLLCDGEKAGFIDAFQVPKRPEIGFLTFCYVVPKKRGSGVGDLLIDYADQLLSEYGCEEILLDVRAMNTRAIRFYEKHGWEVRRNKENGLLLMGRKIRD